MSAFLLRPSPAPPRADPIGEETPCFKSKSNMSEEYRDWQDEPLKVVKNHEGYCSIWPADRENALGWDDVGFSGSKEECLAYIEEHCDADCRWKS